jgi:S-formylglutathione hydrolase FrmB
LILESDPMKFTPRSVAIIVAAVLIIPMDAQEPVFDASRGISSLQLESKFQAGPALVEILQPDKVEASRKYPVLYILPVGGPNGEFGDGLAEAKKLDIANQYGIICVQPFFTKVPWYGNHATDSQIQQERYVVEVLVPYIDSHLPTSATSEGRWLIGFSKSGWGAFTLMARHPDVFGYAAAWDAPFMIQGDPSSKDWGPMGIKSVFGTPDALRAFLPTRLVAERASGISDGKRLVIGPGKAWLGQVRRFHELLEKSAVPHVYRDDAVFAHRWDSGWFPEFVAELVKLSRERQSAK